MLYQARSFRPKAAHLVSLTIVCLLFLAGYQFAGQVGNVHHHDPLLNSADVVAYAVCHRFTSHSFEIFGRSLPLCARCSGIYLGIALSFSFTLFTARSRHAQFPSLIPSTLLISLFLLMALDGTNAFLHDINQPHLYEPHNTIRLLTGLGAGLAIGLTVTTVFAQTAWRHLINQPQTASLRELGLQLAIAAAIALLILSNQTTTLYVLAIVSAVSVIAVLSLLYTILTLIVLRKDGTIVQGRQLLLPSIIGTILACVQLGLIATARFTLTGTWSGF